MTKTKLFLKYLLLAISVWYLLVYFYMVYYPIQYPFELDWIEGGLLGVVQRIVNGQAVYAASNLEFVAFIYPPLFLYLSALASHFFGATMEDMLRGKKDNRGETLLNAALSETKKNQTSTMIITDTQWDFLPRLEKYYEIKDDTFKENRYFYPVTGARIRPTHIYFPKVL